ncbi:response regulator transcription factor [Nocardioides soli]|uniref:DNA-binding NarL/FixJ family response regulator n=1 Tax=Nocardioides soli TaxID=1036020 RepID=A0A7W4W0V0_9ACTN|nr:response regulator transcription factor [Nocardioides soli]MBB3044879.1 DNA-binding NarL/FixJ family response regulator [Nocardioides soli]
MTDTDTSTDTDTDTADVTPLPRRRPPRLTIVEQHAAFSDALEGSLWGRFRVRQVVVPGRATAAGIVAAARATRPDLALVSSRLGPYVDGEAVIDGLSGHGAAVVALCSTPVDRDPASWGRWLRAGAVGVLSHSCDLATLRDALDRAAAGRPLLDAAQREPLLAAARRADDHAGSARSRLDSLTPREREIVTQLMGGRSTAAIAREGVVSEATVRTQIKSIFAKLGVNSQLAAVALAHQAGWSAPAEHWLSVAG